MALACTDLPEGAFPKTPADDFAAAILNLIDHAATRREPEITAAYECGETDERSE